MKKFFALILILLIFAAVGPTKAFSSEGVSLPAKYDLRTYGYVPDVMDQGTDQTCWTFAAMSAISSNYLKNAKEYNHGSFLGNDSDLSKLHLAWFSFKNPDKKKSFAFTKYGQVVEPSNSEVMNHAGNPQMALAFLTRHDGPVRESDLPYSGGYPASGASPNDYKTVLRVRGANYVEALNLDTKAIANQEEMIKGYIMDIGAVDIGVYWDKNYVSKNNAYYYPYTSRGGHAVTIVGWDDDYSLENFVTPPSRNGAWLVQNSWGTSWGDNGYFWMSYEQMIRYAMVFNTEEFNSRIREYEHDDLGFTHEVLLSEVSSDTVAVANIFKVKGDNEKLREIGYYSTGSSFLGMVAVLDMGTDNSLESFNRARSDTNSIRNLDFIIGLTSKGYNVHDLSEAIPLQKDHYIGIMVSLFNLSVESNDNVEALTAGFNPTIAAEVNVPNTRTANAEINANETYFSVSGGEWQDAKNYSFNVGSNTVTGFNACIKGFSYIPDERRADDWTIISEDNKAQISIPILLETAPKKITVKGDGITNLMYKTELENSDTGGEAGKFYTLKLIFDFTSDDAAIKNLIIDGEEKIKGNMRGSPTVSLLIDKTEYFDVSETGVKLKDMVSVSGTIEDTQGYTKNSEAQSQDEQETKQESNNSSNGNSGSGGGCDLGISVLEFGILFAAFIFKREAR